MFMRNYKNFERDVKSMSKDVEIRVHTVDGDWKTRILTDYYHIDGLNYASPTPPVNGINTAPMFGVGRSNEVNDLTKLRVNGMVLNPRERQFFSTQPPSNENLRVWLSRNINELSSSSGSPGGSSSYSPSREEEVKKEEVSKILDSIKTTKPPSSTTKPVFFQMVSLD